MNTTVLFKRILLNASKTVHSLRNALLYYLYKENIHVIILTEIIKLHLATKMFHFSFLLWCLHYLEIGTSSSSLVLLLYNFFHIYFLYLVNICETFQYRVSPQTFWQNNVFLDICTISLEYIQHVSYDAKSISFEQNI